MYGHTSENILDSNFAFTNTAKKPTYVSLSTGLI